jgi:hypothetical protein
MFYGFDLFFRYCSMERFENEAGAEVSVPDHAARTHRYQAEAAFFQRESRYSHRITEHISNFPVIT